MVGNPARKIRKRFDDGLIELLEKFKERQAKVRPAVEAMIAEAEKAANGETEYSTYEDIFGTED